MPDNLSYGRWLKINDAVDYSKIGRDELKSLVLSGQIRGYQRGKRQDYIIDRYSIDEYHLSFIKQGTKDQALKILQSLSG